MTRNQASRLVNFDKAERLMVVVNYLTDKGYDAIALIQSAKAYEAGTRFIKVMND